MLFNYSQESYYIWILKNIKFRNITGGLYAWILTDNLLSAKAFMKVLILSSDRWGCFINFCIVFTLGSVGVVSAVEFVLLVSPFSSSYGLGGWTTWNEKKGLPKQFHMRYRVIQVFLANKKKQVQNLACLNSKNRQNVERCQRWRTCWTFNIKAAKMWPNWFSVSLCLMTQAVNRVWLFHYSQLQACTRGFVRLWIPYNNM